MKKGFTLIEIMVTLSIIGLLTVGAVASFSRQRAYARDSRRIQDVNNIAQALDLLYNQEGDYSLDNAEAGYRDTSVGLYMTAEVPDPPTASDWSTSSDLQDLITAGLISKLPVDPINNATYHYSFEMDDIFRNYWLEAHTLEVQPGNIDGYQKYQIKSGTTVTMLK